MENKEPKPIKPLGKWRATTYIPKGCRKPRYTVGLRTNHTAGGDFIVHPLFEDGSIRPISKEVAEDLAVLLNNGR